MSSLASKIGLARGLLGGGAAHAGPFYAGVELTRRCNLKCVGCRFHSPLTGPASSSKPEDLDVPMFRAACRELREMGTRTLLLTGEGEPLLHPRFAEVLAATREAGFRTVRVDRWFRWLRPLARCTWSRPGASGGSGALRD